MFTVLSDERRTMTVGLLKELADATPGGSGFSFGDLVADRAGSLGRALKMILRKRLSRVVRKSDQQHWL